MKTILSVVLVAAVLAATARATVVPHIGPAVPLVPPTVQLNLDLPPVQRWQEIAKLYRNQLWEAYAEINWLLPNSLDTFFEVFGWWAKYLFKYQEMALEIQGIADVTDVPFAKLFFINFMYEFSTVDVVPHMCTSTVVRNATNHILHGRNLDFVLWNRLAKLQARVQFYRGGKYVATVDSFVGAVWALTAFKENAFSVTVDTRHPRKDDEKFKNVIQNVFVNQYEPSVWLVREAVVNAPDFATAREMLITRNVTAPIYYILAGLSGNEGTVIEKQPVGTHAYYDLNATTWFLVQTNYDRDAEEPFYDRRRFPAERRISAIGQTITIDQLYSGVMTQWPTFNIGSILTFTSVPSLAYNQTVTWYPTINSTQVSA